MKLHERLLKLVLPTATAKATTLPPGCHFGCGTDGVFIRGTRTADGKLPCC
jgi:hypothetical protein